MKSNKQKIKSYKFNFITLKDVIKLILKNVIKLIKLNKIF